MLAEKRNTFRPSVPRHLVASGPGVRLTGPGTRIPAEALAESEAAGEERTPARRLRPVPTLTGVRGSLPTP